MNDEKIADRWNAWAVLSIKFCHIFRSSTPAARTCSPRIFAYRQTVFLTRPGDLIQMGRDNRNTIKQCRISGTFIAGSVTCEGWCNIFILWNREKKEQFGIEWNYRYYPRRLSCRSNSSRLSGHLRIIGESRHIILVSAPGIVLEQRAGNSTTIRTPRLYDIGILAGETEIGHGDALMVYEDGSTRIAEMNSTPLRTP